MNNDNLLTNLTMISKTSRYIVNDIGITKKALAALLTDKDRRDIYDDIYMLMNILESIYRDANTITEKTEDVKKELEEKKNHN